MFDMSKEILRDNIKDYLREHTISELIELVTDIIKEYWFAGCN